MCFPPVLVRTVTGRRLPVQALGEGGTKAARSRERTWTLDRDSFFFLDFGLSHLFFSHELVTVTGYGSTIMAPGRGLLRAVMVGAAYSACLLRPCHAFTALAPAQRALRCSASPSQGFGHRNVRQPAPTRQLAHPCRASMSLGDVLLQPQFQVRAVLARDIRRPPMMPVACSDRRSTAPAATGFAQPSGWTFALRWPFSWLPRLLCW